MDMDVKRICATELKLLIEELLDAKTAEEANQLYEDGMAALSSLHNAIVTKFECQIEHYSSRVCKKGTKSCIVKHETSN